MIFYGGVEHFYKTFAYPYLTLITLYLPEIWMFYQCIFYSAVSKHFHLFHSFALYGNMYGIYTNIRVLLINMHCLFGFPPFAFFLASSSIKISIIFPMFFFLLLLVFEASLHQVYLPAQNSYLP